MEDVPLLHSPISFLHSNYSKIKILKLAKSTGIFQSVEKEQQDYYIDLSGPIFIDNFKQIIELF